MSTWTRVFSDSDWVMAYYYNKYEIYHNCSKAVYSWDKTHKKGLAFVDVYYRCIACNEKAPNEMIGMKELCNWER